MINPASLNFAVKKASSLARFCCSSFDPDVSSSPFTAWEMSLSKTGTPANGCSSVRSAAASFFAFSNRVRMTAFKRLFVFSIRAIAASSTSSTLTSFRFMSLASSVASYDRYADGSISIPPFTLILTEFYGNVKTCENRLTLFLPGKNALSPIGGR